MEHTPGPWAINKKNEVVIRWGSKPGEYTVYVPDEVHESQIADARLIAAAPDLLEVCHNAVGAYEALKSVGADLILLGYDRCLKRLNQAIKKAEGK